MQNGAKWSILPLVLCNLFRFTWAHISSVVGFLWMVSLPFIVPTAPVSCVISELADGALNPTVQVINKGC